MPDAWHNTTAPGFGGPRFHRCRLCGVTVETIAGAPYHPMRCGQCIARGTTILVALR